MESLEIGFDMDKQFWNRKNVLITGYEGFLGSWLTKVLLTTNANIFGLDIKTHRKETILKPEDLSRIQVIEGSVESYTLVYKILKINKIDIVFHLGAKALVGECLKYPLKAFSTNIRGTWNILECCRLLKTIQAVVIASSDKAYGESKKLPYYEDFPLRGNHPYDVSKSCADLLASAYAHTYNLPVAIVRCGNIYGPGDFNFSRIVPDTMKCIFSDKTLFIRSDGTFVRDYIYVLDVVYGYILLAEKMQDLNLKGESFNFSNEKPVSVLNLVKKIYKICGYKPNYKILNETRYEIKNQYLSSRKARRVLNWRPEYSLEKGLRKTVEWYKNYFISNER